MILTSSNFRVPGMHSSLAQYVQAISYIATPLRRQWCLAMATRMMSIRLLGISVRGSNLEFVTLKVDSLRTSLAHETIIRAQSRLAVVDALFAAVWVDCRLRPNNPVAIYYNYHKLFYPSLTHAMSAALFSHARK